MGTFHLEPPLRCVRSGREDVQDDASPVEHLAVKRALDVALLARQQVGVHDQHVGACGATGIDRLLQLALSDERGWIGLTHAHKSTSGDLGSRGFHETPELIERGVGRPIAECLQAINAEQERALTSAHRPVIRS